MPESASMPQKSNTVCKVWSDTHTHTHTHTHHFVVLRNHYHYEKILKKEKVEERRKENWIRRVSQVCVYNMNDSVLFVVVDLVCIII